MSDELLKAIAGAPDRPLVIGDIAIPCYVLEDERRVLQQTGLLGSLSLSHGGSYSKGGDRLAKFASQGRLKSFVNKGLIDRTEKPIKFKVPSGNLAYGYEATVLADLCEAVLEARNAGVLQKQQEHVALRAELLIRGFARIGIIALVDEATGYQHIREERALATILEKFIAEELRPWTRTFPPAFYQEIFRLKNWPGPDGVKRPSIIGVYTNDIVYDRLAPGVLDELKRKNPTIAPGRRRNRHHQWLTGDIGHPKLKDHLIGVMALMRASPNWNVFKRMLERSYKKSGEQLGLDV